MVGARCDARVLLGDGADDDLVQVGGTVSSEVVRLIEAVIALPPALKTAGAVVARWLTGRVWAAYRADVQEKARCERMVAELETYFRTSPLLSSPQRVACADLVRTDAVVRALVREARDTAGARRVVAQLREQVPAALACETDVVAIFRRDTVQGASRLQTALFELMDEARPVSERKNEESLKLNAERARSLDELAGVLPTLRLKYDIQVRPIEAASKFLKEALSESGVGRVSIDIDSGRTRLTLAAGASFRVTARRDEAVQLHQYLQGYRQGRAGKLELAESDQLEIAFDPPALERLFGAGSGHRRLTLEPAPDRVDRLLRFRVGDRSVIVNTTVEHRWNDGAIVLKPVLNSPLASVVLTRLPETGLSASFSLRGAQPLSEYLPVLPILRLMGALATPAERLIVHLEDLDRMILEAGLGAELIGGEIGALLAAASFVHDLVDANQLLRAAGVIDGDLPWPASDGGGDEDPYQNLHAIREALRAGAYQAPVSFVVVPDRAALAGLAIDVSGKHLRGQCRLATVRRAGGRALFKEVVELDDPRVEILDGGTVVELANTRELVAGSGPLELRISHDEARFRVERSIPGEDRVE